MPTVSHRHTLADKRRKRVRSKILATSQRPRLTIFRSNKYTYLQVIDDKAGKTVAAASTLKAKKGTKVEQAQAAAQVLAEQLTTQKVTAVVLDRGSYKYHGRVKAVAEALRSAKVEV